MFKGVIALVLLATHAFPVRAPADDLQDARSRGIRIARDVKSALKGRYFDPAFRGVDIEASFAKTEAAIKEATTRGQIMGLIAQALADLQDSHTILIPPMITAEFDYGFETMMVDEDCLVTRVKTGSDAEHKGLRKGDLVLSIDGVKPTRDNLDTLWYVFSTIQPRGGLNLIVRSGDDAPRRVPAAARVQTREKMIDIWRLYEDLQRRSRESPQYAWRYWTYKEEKVVVVKLYTFMITDDTINELMDQVNEAKALIVDLRGNPGGSIAALQIAAGAFFKDEVEMGIQNERKSKKAFRSRRPKTKRLFEGELVVLVDSASQSSAEILARVVQLEKRGRVVGDRTAGRVMIAEMVPLNAGNSMSMVPYGLSVSIAQLLMKDGESLEGKGVVPDDVVLPTGEDLEEDRDPAMSHAAKLVGLNLSPSAAWSHFHPKPAPSPSPARSPRP